MTYTGALWQILIFLITVLLLVNFAGETATLWILVLILLGMVYANWSHMGQTYNELRKGWA